MAGSQSLRMLEYVDRKALDIIRSRFPDIPQEAQAALLIESEGEADLDEWDAAAEFGFRSGRRFLVRDERSRP